MKWVVINDLNDFIQSQIAKIIKYQIDLKGSAGKFNDLDSDGKVES